MEEAQISTEALLDMDNERLSTVLSNKPPAENPRADDLEALLPYFERELARTGIKRMVPWGGYKRRVPEGYNHSRFCYRFRRWHKARQGSMHFDHETGGEMYSDFAGTPLFISDRGTGTMDPVDRSVTKSGFPAKSMYNSLPGSCSW